MGDTCDTCKVSDLLIYKAFDCFYEQEIFELFDWFKN